MSKPELGLTQEQGQTLLRVEKWTRDLFMEHEPAVLHRMGGHGFDKSIRGVGWAKMISEGEGYPPFLPVLTYYLMDIGRTSNDLRATNYGHGELSREMSAAFLNSLEILTNEERVLVGDAIEDHPKLNDKVRRTWLAEIVMDADRLDCLGPLGPLRAASGLWQMPLVLPDQLATDTGWKDVKSIRDNMFFQLAWFDMLWTETARKIAQPKLEHYRRYIESVDAEAKLVHAEYKSLLEKFK